MDGGGLGRPDNLLPSRIGPAKGDIGGDGVGKENRLLADIADMGADKG